MRALGEVANQRQSAASPQEIDTATPYIALEHMPKQCISLSEWGTADGLASNKFRFKRGDILFGKLRPYFHKVGVAPLDGVCSTDIVVITPVSADWFGFVLDDYATFRGCTRPQGRVIGVNYYCRCASIILAG